MTATFVLQRHSDPSGISGTGVVAHGVEFDDGAVALHWHGDAPATAVWSDIRHVEKIHGHEGQTMVEYSDKDRLLKAYERVVHFLLTAQPARRPLTCGPHPDHPDRLRLTFHSESAWRFWIALFDGSTDAAVHEEINGEIEHRWVSPDGNLWLAYFTVAPGVTTEDLLAGETYAGTAWESHDDPEVNR